MMPKLLQTDCLLDRRGFTMVELMIVLVIIAILAAVIAPNVSSYMKRSQAQEAARDVSNTLRMARSHAMSRGEIMLAEVERGTSTQGENGRIELFRTDTSGNAEFDCDENDPNDTDCFALSCAQATALRKDDLVSVEELDLAATSPEMAIADLRPRPSGDGSNEISRMLCFSPSGRVLASGGLALSPGGDEACDFVGMNIWVGRQPSDGGRVEMDNPVGGPELNECVDDEDQYKKQRQGRQAAYFWEISVPYNGAVSMSQ
ncbi:MAG: pilus assembly FimT family protein [Persicimonas sp.]